MTEIKDGELKDGELNDYSEECKRQIDNIVSGRFEEKIRIDIMQIGGILDEIIAIKRKRINDI